MPAFLRYNVYAIRERPSVDRGARGPAGEDRSGPAICEGCGSRFWSWDVGQCWHCDDCRPPLRPRAPSNGQPRADPDDEAWVHAAREEETRGSVAARRGRYR
jgi:hypothetical protein